MSYLTAAHNRLIAQLTAAKPVSISMWPTSEEASEQASHIDLIGSIFAEYLHAVAIDGKYSIDNRTITTDFSGFVSDGVSELSGEFRKAAEDLAEDEPREQSEYAAHNVLNRAQQGV